MADERPRVHQDILQEGTVVAVHHDLSLAVAGILGSDRVIALPPSGRVPVSVLERHASAVRVVALVRDEGDVRDHARHLDLTRLYVAPFPVPLTRDSVSRAIAAAQPWVPRGVRTWEQAVCDLRDYLASPVSRGLRTGWEALDRLVSIRPGDLVGLLGYWKRGKTTFLVQLAHNFASRGLAVWILNFEEAGVQVALRLAAIELGKDRDSVTEDDCGELIVRRLPVAITGRGDAPTDLDQIEKLIRKTHRRLGLDLIIVDNLNYIVRSHDRQVESLGIASKLFREMSAKLQVATVVAVQARKPEHGRDGPPDPEDARYAGDFLADCDTKLVVHRWRRPGVLENGDLYEPYMLVRVGLARYGRAGDVLMVLDGARSVVREATREEVEEFARLRGIRVRFSGGNGNLQQDESLMLS